MKKMWYIQREWLRGQQGVKVKLFYDRTIPIPFADVLSGWLNNTSLQRYFLAELTAVAPAAFFWEMPPLTRLTIDRPFECVLIDSPLLERAVADRRPFAAQIQGVSDPVVSFRNLGGDAHLIVPTAASPEMDYAHLGAFLRNAPLGQQEALLQKVAEVVLAEVGERPLWLSTSGLGVYWLHLRLDSRPKYYTYTPYREM